jgi:hypothetical protein
VDSVSPKLKDKILWHIGQLLGGECEIGDCTAAVSRQRLVINNKEIVFSARSAKEQTSYSVESLLRGYK